MKFLVLINRIIILLHMVQVFRGKSFNIKDSSSSEFSSKTGGNTS